MNGRLCAIAAVAVLAPATASAELDAYDALGIMLGMVFEVPAVIAGGGNAYHGFTNTRPHAAVLVMGYSTGALSAAFGAWVLASLSPHDATSLSVGVSALAVGLLDVGVTVWAHSRPGRRTVTTARVVVAPLVAPAGGGAALHLRW